MAGKKRFDVLIVPPSTGDTIQLSVPQFLVSLAGLVLVCGILLFGFLLLGYIERQEATEQLDTLKSENAFLQSRLAGIRSSMATFGQYLGEIEQTEKNIRLVFGFPEIDPAERALGIGGFPPVSDSARNPYRRLSYSAEADIAHLLRRTRFERENFDRIYESLVEQKDQLDHTPSIVPTRGYFASRFGVRRHPFTGERCLHRGVDFAAPVGTPIIAPADGKVTSIKYHRDFGKTVVLDHSHGLRTVYGHLLKAKIKVGQKVKRGEVIALMGNSGLSTGPHLHYEVHVNGRPVDPVNYIYDFPTSSRSRL